MDTRHAPSSGETVSQAHLVGLDDQGMPGLAQMLIGQGYRVTGSTASTSPAVHRLRELGVRIHPGHSPGPLSRAARLLVYGSNVPREHPDRLSATRHGIEQASCSEVLSGLLGRGVGIAVSGCRKASLAAAMIGWTLTRAGLDPSVILGSDAPQLGGSGRIGRGPHFLVEANDPQCEFERSGAEMVLLHEESDPSTRPARIRRWLDFAPPGGYVLGFADEGEGVESIETADAEVERFSLAPGHAWWGADLREDRGLYRFRAFHHGRFVVEVRLRVPGRHHVLGALATVAICDRVALDRRVIKEALEEFDGISRGFESRGSYRGVTLIDDEAPGHRGVGEALTIARQVFGRRRLCAVYRPTDGEVGGPAASDFARADRVWILDEGGPSGGSAASLLAEALGSAGARVRRASGLDEVICELDQHLEPGDVLLTLGAGDVGTIADAFLRRL